jgi:hypothetical protein
VKARRFRSGNRWERAVALPVLRQAKLVLAAAHQQQAVEVERRIRKQRFLPQRLHLGGELRSLSSRLFAFLQCGQPLGKLLSARVSFAVGCVQILNRQAQCFQVGWLREGGDAREEAGYDGYE